MKIDLADFLDVESGLFFVREAIFYEKTQILSLDIEGEALSEEDRKKIYDYFSFVKLELNLRKKIEEKEGLALAEDIEDEGQADFSSDKKGEDKLTETEIP